MIQTLLPILQIVLTSANILVLGYAFMRFLSKPHNTLENRVTALELETKEMKQSLLQGNDRFRAQEDTNEVMMICMLALIDFELSYCAHTNYDHTEDLIKAKNLLREHLARK